MTNTDLMEMLLAVVLSFWGYFLLIISKGEPLETDTMKHIAKALLTGLLSAGVWAALEEFTTLRGETVVAVSIMVTVLGVDYILITIKRIIRNIIKREENKHK